MNCPAENKWKKEIDDKFGHIYKGGKILEIGSAIASSNGYFTDVEHIGLDVAPGGGVNVVSIAHEYNAPDGSFDAVCSFSAFEHDMYWKKTLKKMVKLTKKGGLIFFSCCMNWEEHGTNKTSPEQSYTTQVNEDWANYYKNITPADIKTVWNLKKLFSEYELGLNPYDDGITAFWGIKR